MIEKLVEVIFSYAKIALQIVCFIFGTISEFVIATLNFWQAWVDLALFIR